MKTTFRVHWLTVTIWGSHDYGYKMWEQWFSSYLGSMNQSGHGGRGFRKLSKAMLEASFYSDPILQEAVDKEQMRSCLPRRSMKYTVSPYELRDDGQLGTSSLRLGSDASDRMLRVYDKRGPVRLELQSRKDRPDLLAREVLKQKPHEWDKPAIAHLRGYVDFIDIETDELLPWWEVFVKGTDRAMKTLSDAREVELNRMIDWINTQVSPTLSVLADVIGEQSIEAFIVDGCRKRGPKYRALLEVEGNGYKQKR